jgi:hypothetical protein
MNGRMFPLLVAALIFLAAGCATNRVDWGARVGSYTFDQAVMEYGPPDKQAKLQDGTVVAEWLTRRGYTQTSPAPIFYPGYYGGHYPVYPVYNDIQVPDYFLRLTFGPDGKLAAWKKFVR